MTLEDIAIKSAPIAEKYNARLYVFGSFARGTNTESSDIDFAVDTKDSKIKSLFDLGAFFDELKNAFDIYFDLITYQSLFTSINKKAYPDFIDEFTREAKVIYDRKY
jgi:predicted nucleotidyltransferase